MAKCCPRTSSAFTRTLLSPTSSTPTYDPSAEALFTAVGDMPVSAKTAYNTFVLALKSAEVWSKLKYALTCPPTLTNSKGLIDLVSATQIATWGDNAVSPFGTLQSSCYPGCGFKLGAGSLGYIKTGFIPSASLTLDSSAIFDSQLTATTISSNYDVGAFVSPNAFTMNNFFTGNLQRSQMYSNSAGGIGSFAGGNGAVGTYWANRNASNFFEVGYNATQRGTVVSSNGALPGVQVYWGALNNNGTAGTVISKRGSMLLFFSGLTTTERASVVTAIDTFNTNMYRTGLTKQIVVDGNSHLVYWNEKTFRTHQYNLFGTGRFQYTNFSVSGQTTTQMLSDEATQIQNQYNGAYTKNILLAYEGTNDMHVGGISVADSLTNMATYVANAKSYGYTVCVKKQFCRTRPTSGPGVVTYPNVTAWNLAVDEYNTGLSGIGADYIIECDSLHFIPRSSYGSDALYNTAVASLIAGSTFNGDGTHLTEAGYKIEADIDSITLALAAA